MEDLRGQASAAEVYYALTLLEQNGYLSEGDQILPVSEAAYWSIQGFDPQMVASVWRRLKFR